ncbi:hypothetical protein [Legionella yabuuchiae]|uniref:hypothetical protein n=1 Tax=Legionella yabuuchiae TaxID=376727 RepID=UPI001054ECD1|nr:hypothetical protein [Legionella yabuuchiae]
MASVLRQFGYFAQGNSETGGPTITTHRDVKDGIIEPIKRNLDSVERMIDVRPSEATNKAVDVLETLVSRLEEVLEKPSPKSTTSMNI